MLVPWYIGTRKPQGEHYDRRRVDRPGVCPFHYSPRPKHKDGSGAGCPGARQQPLSFPGPGASQQAAPLFGPEGERSWAGAEWDPLFLYPQPAKDVQGAVFTVQQGGRKSVWIATLFDVDGGRMQYVSVVPGIRASTVDVRLTAVDASTTSVEVTYVRTALDSSANEEVQALGESDRLEGPHWQESDRNLLQRAARKETITSAKLPAMLRWNCRFPLQSCKVLGQDSMQRGMK